jgi:hypothetical protein
MSKRLRISVRGKLEAATESPIVSMGEYNFIRVVFWHDDFGLGRRVRQGSA